jgi:hypothetical protein
VTAVPARHGPVGCEPITGDVTGFVLGGVGVPTVYVSGDNAALELVSEVAERFPRIDVALLFAGAARTSLFDGAPLTLTSANAAKAAALLGAPQLPIPDRRHNRRVVRATSATLWRRSWWCGDGAEARSSTTPRGTPPQHR